MDNDPGSLPSLVAGDDILIKAEDEMRTTASTAASSPLPKSSVREFNNAASALRPRDHSIASVSDGTGSKLLSSEAGSGPRRAAGDGAESSCAIQNTPSNAALARPSSSGENTAMDDTRVSTASCSGSVESGGVVTTSQARLLWRVLSDTDMCEDADREIIRILTGNQQLRLKRSDSSCDNESVLESASAAVVTAATGRNGRLSHHHLVSVLSGRNYEDSAASSMTTLLVSNDGGEPVRRARCEKRPYGAAVVVAGTCQHCQTDETPQWRYVHREKFCNACYMRIKRWVHSHLTPRKLPSRARMDVTEEEDQHFTQQAKEIVQLALQSLNASGSQQQAT